MMTDSLIVLNSNEHFGGEGFFKFENGYRNMTVCFQKISRGGRYMWAAVDTGLVCGEFPSGKTVFSVPSVLSRKPKKCGIFLVEDGKAYPVLTSGAQNEILAEFCRQNQLEAGEVPAAPAAASAEDSPENNADAAVQTEQILEVKPEEAENTSGDEGGSISAQKAETVQEEASAVFSVPRQEPNTYWDCNEASFLKMLEENPEEEEMNLLIPGSKWVRIREDDVAYIMGIIYDEDGTPMYLCYGFPEPWSENPPENLEGYSQWIPLDCAHPHDQGYWVIYINAKTGERVR